MVGLCHNLTGISEGRNRKIWNWCFGISVYIHKDLLEFLTFWRQGDDLLRQSGRGFRFRQEKDY